MSEAEFAMWVLGFFTLVVVGAVAVLGWVTYWIYKAKLLAHEERRHMIEKGIVPPANVPGGWPGVRMRELELKAEERRLMIEKGLDVFPDGPPTPVAQDSLSRGLGWLAIGLGLAAGYIVFKTSGFDASQTTENWFLFFGVISPGVTLYGIANIVHYRMTRNRLPAPPTGPDPVR